LTTTLLCAVVGLMNPVFLSAPNLLDLVRNSITTGLFALGVLLNVSSLWDRCVVGVLIILGAGVPLLLRRLQSARSG
jgi:hypothetical protein